jgi:hypothetical protein
MERKGVSKIIMLKKAGVSEQDENIREERSQLEG